MKQGILITDDLMKSSGMLSQAAELGYELKLLTNGELALQHLKEEPACSVLLLDLSCGSSVPEWLVAIPSAAKQVRLISFGPHVHAQKLETAAECGWEVYTNGQIHSSLAQILSANVS